MTKQIIKQVCWNCGNETEHVIYDGALGYEASVCTDCASYEDNNGKYEPCDFSKDLLHSMGYVIFEAKTKLSMLDDVLAFIDHIKQDTICRDKDTALLVISDYIKGYKRGLKGEL